MQKNRTFPLCLFLLLLLGLAACTGPSLSAEKKQSDNVFDIHRGVNISHWLSQSRSRGPARQAYFIERDIQAVAEAGFDHIRIPIDEVQMWDSLGNKEKEAFDLLHQALGWMAKHELKAIVDLHIIRSHYFLDKDPPLFIDPKEQEKFAGLWAQLSEELVKYPVAEVAYELLNESVAKDHEDWNKVFRMAYDQVRLKEPDRVIFIGPNRWQNAAYFPYLKVPENDPNLVLSFHFYSPHIVTHYQASWEFTKDYTGPIHYPGVSIDPQDTVGLSEEMRAALSRYTSGYMDKDQLEAMMQVAIVTADSLNLQLYCGEFGCLTTGPSDIRQRWFADMISIFDKHHIAWSIWDLKSGGFGVFDAKNYSLTIPENVLFGDQDLEVLKHLIPK